MFHLFQDMVIGHQDNLIWHRWIILYWDYVKSQVYKCNPQSISQVTNEIYHVIGEIKLHLWQNVINNFNRTSMELQEAVICGIIFLQ